MKTLILGGEDLQTLVGAVGLDRLMDQTIAGIEEVCREFDTERYTVPPRGGLAYREPELGLLEWMPALQHGRASTIKLVGYHPANPSARQLPTILSVALEFDTASGHLNALVDGVFATALRTGAASAVASRVLAAPQSSVLGLIGCGAQALTQLHALSRVFPLRRVLAYDSDPAIARDFVARAAVLGLASVQISVAALEDLSASADILCTATSVEIGQGPVFHDAALQAHVHVNAVGSDFSGKTELPLTLLKRALVCPDFPAQALAEGECQQLAADELGPSLSELVTGAADFEAWRARATVFDSTGWALEDHVVVGLLVEHARRLGCGTPMQLESNATDPRNPYGFAGHVASPGPGRVRALR